MKVSAIECKFFIYAEVGAWEAVQASRHAPFDSMQVSPTTCGVLAIARKDFLAFKLENGSYSPGFHSKFLIRQTKSFQVWDFSGQGFTRYSAADVGLASLG